MLWKMIMIEVEPKPSLACIFFRNSFWQINVKSNIWKLFRTEMFRNQKIFSSEIELEELDPRIRFKLQCFWPSSPEKVRPLDYKLLVTTFSCKKLLRIVLCAGVQSVMLSNLPHTEDALPIILNCNENWLQYNTAVSSPYHTFSRSSVSLAIFKPIILSYLKVRNFFIRSSLNCEL